MAKLEGLTLSESEVSQELNVSDILGVDVSNEPRIIQEFGQAVIDRIVERTEAGKDVRGRNFKPYSKSYINSEDFEEFDKSPSDINMTMTGDMIDSIDFTQRGSTVKVQVGEGDVQTAKAYNHNFGDTLPKRQFFGVNKKDLNEIKKKFKDDIKRLKREGSRDEPIREELFTAASFVETASPVSIFDEFLGDIFDEG